MRRIRLSSRSRTDDDRHRRSFNLSITPEKLQSQAFQNRPSGAAFGKSSAVSGHSTSTDHLPAGTHSSVRPKALSRGCQRVLSTRLKSLQKEDVVVRVVDETATLPTVSYVLTENGNEIADVITQIEASEQRYS
ncbi:winged helix-turn-helix transcriptional regulator [Natrinema zhouii]|uniref:winged helix-turn-helix transcriptional regulator n=1 Tax=Natrinema zhouii TaxID=1710539 RepID=UPI0030F46AEA